MSSGNSKFECIFNVPGKDSVGQMKGDINNEFCVRLINFLNVVASFLDSSVYSVLSLENIPCHIFHV